jgi:alpha-ketoglutarate-dependent taurine dioxygenase
VYLKPEQQVAQADDMRSFVRPLVLRHPATSETILFLSRRFWPAIVDLPPAESASLIAELVSYQDRLEFQYRHRWQPGDLVVWDNITLQHARTDFDPKYRRTLRRVVFGASAAMDRAVTV